MPETVGQPRRQQFGHLASLLRGESRIVFVGRRVFDIDLLMRHVQITADDHRFLSVQPPDIGAKIILPLQAVFQTGEATLGVGGIHVHQLKFIVFQRDDPAFLVMFRHAHAVGNRQRLNPRKNGRAGIPLLYGAVPKLFIADKADFRLPGLHLGFLDADDIGVRGGEKISKPFVQTGPESIDIP